MAVNSKEYIASNKEAEAYDLAERELLRLERLHGSDHADTIAAQNIADNVPSLNQEHYRRAVIDIQAWRRSMLSHHQKVFFDETEESMRDMVDDSGDALATMRLARFILSRVPELFDHDKLMNIINGDIT